MLDLYENVTRRVDKKNTIIEPFIVHIYWIVFPIIVTTKNTNATHKWVNFSGFALLRFVDTIYTLSESE